MMAGLLSAMSLIQTIFKYHDNISIRLDIPKAINLHFHCGNLALKTKRNVCQDQYVNRARNADQAARTCELKVCLFYSQNNKII